MANAGGNRDGEAGFRRNVEGGPSCVGSRFRCAIKYNLTTAIRDFHALSGISSEMILAWIDQPECFLGTVLKENGMRNNFPVEIDVGFGDCGD